jgi:hypothetical protein
MPTIAKEFAEIYGNNGPLGKKNASINNMLKNIVPNQNFLNNVVEGYNKNMNKPIANDLKKPFQFPYLTVFFIVLFLILCIVLYLNRDNIRQLYSKLTTPTVKPEEPIKKPEEPKPEEPKIQELSEENINQNEMKKNEKLKKIENGGVNQLNQKLNQNYKPEQIVKENSYCYIGYDNGQRECTNVFEGDICMSGEVFPKMEICINPHLRP